MAHVSGEGATAQGQKPYGGDSDSQDNVKGLGGENDSRLADSNYDLSLGDYAPKRLHPASQQNHGVFPL